jgi:phosphohistidine phosphatase
VAGRHEAAAHRRGDFAHAEGRAWPRPPRSVRGGCAHESARSRQTAEILAAALDPRPSLVNVDSLAPDGTYAAVIADLEKHARKARLALVGHEPMIGELAARILGSRHPIEFKKGAICRIDIDDLPPAGPGDLRWMLTPKILRALKK